MEFSLELLAVHLRVRVAGHKEDLLGRWCMALLIVFLYDSD